jgi:uncharacterized protein (DUF1800 family)
MAISPSIAAHRFGLGAYPGELQALAADTAGGLWRQTQIRTTQADPDVLRRALVEMRTAATIEDKPARQDALRTLFKGIRQRSRTQFDSAFVTAAQSTTPFIERLTWFWTNHFTVSAKGKPRVLPFAVSFVADAIRPHVLGRFADMLIAVEQHPAMLIYLDNALSVGPGSRAGRNRKRGLNENLAREIFELHTVGVGSGYTQRDVIELARLITGWTVPIGRKQSDANQPFLFAANRHDPGPKTILNTRYGDGLAEGERALRDLAIRPETAQFLAKKLGRHFIADDPPAVAVAHIAKRFTESAGDLARTSQALIEIAADRPDWLAPKYRQPMDHMAAGVRAFGSEILKARQTLPSLIQFGQAPLMAGSPAGYPDKTSDWASPDAVMRRLEWSIFAAKRARISLTPEALAEAIFGAKLLSESRFAVAGAESPSQALTLLLVSPNFMWR